MTPAIARRVAADVFVTLGVAVLYFAFAKLGLALAVRAPQVTSVWPPTGFALAALVLLRRRAIAGIFLGAFVTNATTPGEPLWVAAGVGAGNTLEAMAGAAILARFGFDAALARLRDVLSLFVAVVISPLVSATIGMTFLVAGGVHPPSAAPALWLVWLLGDALGGLVIAPLILVWSGRDRLWHTRGFLEPAVMLSGVMVAGVIIFSTNLPIAYLVFLFFIWSALRLGPKDTTTASLAVNVIAIIATLSGRGPFAGEGPERGLVLVQVFMAVGASTALILSAVSTQSRLAHERAELSEHRLQMAMAGARVGVWDWNIATGEVIWAGALEELHGLPKGGFAGNYEAFRRLIHPDDAKRVEEQIRHSVETHEPYEAEFRLLGADGVVRWTAARAIVIDDSTGKPARMIGVGIDVTQQKEMEEELRLQHRRKDQFLAMLGHELRNPLAAIVHASALLSSERRAEVEEARTVIRRQTRNLSRLVDDLLDVARITRGQIPLDKQPVAVTDAVSAAVEVWRHLIEEKRHTLIVEVASGLRVEGDLTRLTQVFANLVHNAAKFTPAGGTLRITAAAEDGSAVVRIADDGQGMSPDILEHAFELFVQAEPAIDRQQGGLGLGLTLVRRLIEMHGGTVDAASGGPGRGTQITVRLPLAAGVEAPLPDVPRQLEMTAERPRRRVLVVEDNPDVRVMLTLLLKRDGHEVRSATDGHSAIAEARAFAPEVVLLDIGLPGLNGYEVARELRASPETSHAVLVALTGYGQSEDRDRAFEAGFDHHLLKPTQPALVLEVVRTA